MSLNELTNLLILAALCVLVGIEIGKRQRRRYGQGGLSWSELSEMTKALEDLFKTNHADKEPDPFAEERATEHGAVTEVKRTDYASSEEADEAEVELEDLPVSPIKTEPEPVVGADLMTLEERADALRVHIGHDVTVVTNGMSHDVSASCNTCHTPFIAFSHDEAMVLLKQGDAVGTVVTV